MGKRKTTQTPADTAETKTTTASKKAATEQQFLDADEAGQPTPEHAAARRAALGY